MAAAVAQFAQQSLVIFTYQTACRNKQKLKARALENFGIPC